MRHEHYPIISTSGSKCLKVEVSEMGCSFDLSEESIRLGDASKHIPGRPSHRTVWRWAGRGVRGATLETYLVGGRRYTSLAAIARFLVALNTPRTFDSDRMVPDARTEEIQRAENEAERNGL